MGWLCSWLLVSFHNKLRITQAIHWHTVWYVLLLWSSWNEHTSSHIVVSFRVLPGIRYTQDEQYCLQRVEKWHRASTGRRSYIQNFYTYSTRKHILSSHFSVATTATTKSPLTASYLFVQLTAVHHAHNNALRRLALKYQRRKLHARTNQRTSVSLTNQIVLFQQCLDTSLESLFLKHCFRTIDMLLIIGLASRSFCDLHEAQNSS